VITLNGLLLYFAAAFADHINDLGAFKDETLQQTGFFRGWFLLLFFAYCAVVIVGIIILLDVMTIQDYLRKREGVDVNALYKRLRKIAYDVSSPMAFCGVGFLLSELANWRSGYVTYILVCIGIFIVMAGAAFYWRFTPDG
jgi:hypothetical protein